MSDLEHIAIERIKTAAKMSEQAYKLPLVCTYSGGKDSEVLLELFLRSGVNFEVMHSHTTVDAPETVYHIRKRFKELDEKGIKCTIIPPRYKGEPTSMWKLIPDVGMPPSRYRRYCCSILKESGGKNRFIATGVRWAESVKRASRGIYETRAADISKRITLMNDNDDRRRLFENCRLNASRVANPIIDWTDTNIWDYALSEKLNLNPLYQCGYGRVGCIGCPMATTKERMRQFSRYPKYEAAYMRAFDRMLKKRTLRNKERDWQTAEEVFHWWMDDGVLPGQIEMEIDI